MHDPSLLPCFFVCSFCWCVVVAVVVVVVVGGGGGIGGSGVGVLVLVVGVVIVLSKFPLGHCLLAFALRSLNRLTGRKAPTTDQPSSHAGLFACLHLSLVLL